MKSSSFDSSLPVLKRGWANMPSQGARSCCLRHLGLCDRAWWSEKRKVKAERVSFFLVPRDEKLLNRYKERLSWPASIPFPDEAHLCHTHFPESSLKVGKNGWRKKCRRSLPSKISAITVRHSCFGRSSKGEGGEDSHDDNSKCTTADAEPQVRFNQSTTINPILVVSSFFF
jgi:hypothetical protein